VSTQLPPQFVRPVPHPVVTHVPASQTSPVPHACPHDPQFVALAEVSMHVAAPAAPGHEVSPGKHVHTPAEQN